MSNSSPSDVAASYRPRLTIYVVWHPAFERGRRVAEEIHAYYMRDPKRPNARGLGIPVLFRSASISGQALPAEIAVNGNQHTAVVVLVDPKMVNENGWDGYVEALWTTIGSMPDRHRIFPVAFADSDFGLSEKIAEVNFIRLQALIPDAPLTPFLNRLTNEFARLITQRPAVTEVNERGSNAGPPRMELFLSHAKADGLSALHALRDHITRSLPLDTFFDTIDIEAGFLFSHRIDAGIDRGALVVIQTDAYASRVWCQYEVIQAKRHGRPVVVIHAVEEGEVRSFPYMGNVPTIRWQGDQPDRLDLVLGTILREVLRAEYFGRHFDDLKRLFKVPESVRGLPRAPELLTCLALRSESKTVPYFVYPDPPLAKQELELLTELDSDLRLTTPTLLFAKPSAPVDFADRELATVAAHWQVGLSISDSADLAMRGFGKAHLDDAAAEFARFLLAAGATLAYGGDLRKDGFTEILFDLLSAYRAMSGDPVDAVQSYLAWPISLDLGEEQQATLKRTARFHKFGPPPQVGIDVSTVHSSKDMLPPKITSRDRVAWARSLTMMRERMNTEIHARVLIGGQSRGLGKYPGLVEEALLALRTGKPVFLLGAFGGCAQSIIEAVCAQKPAALTLDFQREPEQAGQAIEIYNAEAVARGDTLIDYPALVSEFEQAGKEGYRGLNNGLSPEENSRLFHTMYLPEMIALVLRGLSRLPYP